MTSSTHGTGRDRLCDTVTVGVVLHLGTTVLPLGDRLWAVPVPGLAHELRCPVKDFVLWHRDETTAG